MSARRALRLTLLLGLVWIVVAGVQLVVSYTHLRAGEDAAGDVRASVNAKALRSGDLRDGVEEARDRFERGRRLLNGPVLAPARVFPYLGRQIRSVAAMAAAAEGAAAAGVEPLAEAHRLLADDVSDDDAARLRAVQRIATTLQAADEQLARLDLGPHRALLPPVAERRARLSSDLAELRESMRDAAIISRGVADMLAGPRRYLLFAANNAEMRAGSGMLLSVGEVTFEHGSMAIGDVEPTGELVLGHDAAPPIDGDLAGRWGWLEPNRDFRNLAATPRFEASARLALRMWEARTGGRLDGVMAVDAAALAAVLRSTGAVSVDDAMIEPEDAIDFVLHDQYEAFGTAGTDRDARRDSLGRLATVAFERIADGDAEMVTLMEGLAESARGRHILAWTRRPAEQAAWSAAGIDGALTEDSLGVMLLNRGGNKLDYFVTASCDLDAVVSGGVREVTLRVTLRNAVDPDDEVSYVAGPHPELDTVAGEYIGLLAVTLPSDARHSRFEGAPPLAASGADGPARVIATEVRIPRGETRELVVRTELPATRTQLRLEPSARIPPVRWRFGGDRFTDRERRDISFE